MRHSRWLVPLVAVSAAATLGVFGLQRAPRAQSEAPAPFAGPSVSVGGSGSASGPVERTPEAIAADEAFVPSGPAPGFALEPLPTMPADRYAALKASADAQAPSARPQSARAASPTAETPVLDGVNFLGATEGAVGRNEYPSDDDADVSGTQVVQITNASLGVFDKAGTVLARHSLNALLGTTDGLGDVQVLFDSTWRRWVLTIDDFTPPSSFSNLWLAVSKTNDATGAWFIFKISFGGGPFTSANFLDYPHLGMDQDALLFTANIFNNSNEQYVTTTAFAVAKARPYNGLGFSFGAFTGLNGTLMPSVQLGKPFYGHFPADYFAAAVAGSGVFLYEMVDASTSPAMFGPVGPISGTNFSVPPSAVQPGCAPKTIDTLDGRFQNACYQIPPIGGFADGLLYCVHTVGAGPFPVPVWYAFNPATSTVASSGDFFLSPTSDDFNPAIAADGLGDIFVTETATDPGTVTSPLFVMPEVLFGGALAGSAVTLSATPAGKSSVCLTGNLSTGSTTLERWGDYSAARFDPATSSTGTAGSVVGWITNQKVAGASAWGTKIAKIRQ